MQLRNWKSNLVCTFLNSVRPPNNTQRISTTVTLPHDTQMSLYSLSYSFFFVFVHTVQKKFWLNMILLKIVFDDFFPIKVFHLKNAKFFKCFSYFHVKIQVDENLLINKPVKLRSHLLMFASRNKQASKNRVFLVKLYSELMNQLGNRKIFIFCMLMNTPYDKLLEKNMKCFSFRIHTFQVHVQCITAFLHGDKEMTFKPASYERRSEKEQCAICK